VVRGRGHAVDIQTDDDGISVHPELPQPTCLDEMTWPSDRGFTPSPDAKAKGGVGQQASRLNESHSALISRATFGYPD